MYALYPGRMPVKYALLVHLAVMLTGLSCRQRDVLHEARKAINQGRPGDARMYLQKALHNNTAAHTRAALLLMLANTYALHLGEPRRAMQVYRQLISSDPETPEALEGRLRLAELLRYHTDDLRGAIAELTAARAQDASRAAELSYEIANIYFELENYEQCALETAQLMKTHTTGPWGAKILFLHAEALSMLKGRQADAKRTFATVVSRFPSSKLKSNALYELGRFAFEAGEMARAIQYWVEALEKHPTPAVIQTSIARARSRLHATTPADTSAR